MDTAERRGPTGRGEGWIRRRLNDAAVLVAGLGLALPLILPFA